MVYGPSRSCVSDHLARFARVILPLREGESRRRRQGGAHTPSRIGVKTHYRQYSPHLRSTDLTIDSSITSGAGYPSFHVASIPTIPRYTGRAPTNTCSEKNISRAGSKRVKIPH